MEKTNEILEILNGLGSEWSKQFDKATGLDISFKVDASGKVVVNGEPACLLSEVDPSTVYIGVECFGFFTKAGVEHRICLDWPFEGPARMSHLYRNPA